MNARAYTRVYALFGFGSFGFRSFRFGCYGFIQELTGSELAIDRSLDTIDSGYHEDDQDDTEDGSDSLEPIDVTDTEEAADDTTDNTERQAHEELCTENTPFIAVSEAVGLAEAVKGRHVFVHEKDGGEVPSDGDNETGDTHKHKAYADGSGHEGHEDKELAHVLAILAVEDKERVDGAAFSHFSRERAHGDGRTDIEVRDPDGNEIKNRYENEAQEIDERDGQTILDGCHNVDFLVHNYKRNLKLKITN